MSDLVAGLLRAWVRCGVDLDAENGRDALWLALRRIERGAEAGSAGVAPGSLPAVGEADDRLPSGVDEETRAESTPPAGPAPSEDSGAFGSASPRGFAAGAASALRRIDLPQAAALPGARLLARALRPLRRDVAAPKGLVFDELATVERIAEEGLWLPVFRPATERWLEVVVVVDASLSMWFWRRAVRELERTMSYCGAFRSVATWWLDVGKGSPRLFASDRDLVANRHRRSLNEVTGSGSRRLVLLLSDCVSAAWSDGSMVRQLLHWSRTVPLALVQLLPERLWERTALGDAIPIDLRATTPATANNALHWKPRQPWIDPRREFEGAAHLGQPEEGGRLLLPVASLDPALLNRLARLVCGANTNWMPGYFFHGLDRRAVAGVVAGAEPEAPAPPVFVAPEERVRRFLAVASAPARRLASMVAAAIVLTPKLVSLIRRDLLPTAGQDHEAEVLLGGLLKLRTAPGVDPRSHDEVTLEFFPGVQPLLLERGQAEETVEVLKRAARAVEHHGWSADTFEAWLEDPHSAQGAIDLGDASEASGTGAATVPFLAGAAAILGFVGGAHAGLVRRAAELETEVEDLEEERDYAEEYSFESDDSGLESDESWEEGKGKRRRVPNELEMAQRAGELEEAGELSEAIGLFELLIERYYSLDRPLDEAHARSRIAYLYSQLERGEEALAEMHKALELAEGSQQESSYCLALARFLDADGQLKAALPWYERAAEICRKTGDRRGLVRALGEHAATLLRLPSVELALGVQLDRHRVAEELGDPGELGWVLKDLGRLLEDDGDLMGALDYFEERLEVLRRDEEGSPIDFSAALGDAIRLHQATGDLDSAFKRSEERLSLVQQLGPIAGAQVFSDHSYLWEEAGDLKAAVQFEEEALGLHQQADDDLGVMDSSARLARLAGKLERPDEARRHHQRRLELAGTVGDDRDHVFAMLDYGRFLGHQGDIESAISYLEEARSLAQKAEPLDRATVLAELARWQEQVENLKEAEGLLGERIALLSGAGLMADSISARSDLASFFARHERIEEALALSRERQGLAQSMLSGDEGRFAVIEALAGHGSLLESAGEMVEAVRVYEERSTLVGIEDDLWAQANSAGDLARVYDHIGKRELARDLLEKLWPRLVEQARTQPQALAAVGEHLAELRIEAGDGKGAAEVIDQTETAYQAVRDTAGLERLRELRGGLFSA